MKVQKVSAEDIKLNPNNPRTITEEKFKKLVESLRSFSEMANVRPVVVNKDMMILGGNMRYRAMVEVGWKEIPVVVVDWDEAKQREFIIKDNVSGGDWDWDLLANEWDIEALDEWGLKVPTRKNTDLLSSLEYESVYYEPDKKPDLKLEDCLDLDKFKAKLKVIEDADLTKKQKEMLKWFAYRFIKIDFENVANYYYFNANDKEKEVMERLRLVLVDNGLNGFIEDDLLRVISITDEDVEW